MRYLSKVVSMRVLKKTCQFQFDFDWDDPDDKFAPEDETWKAEKAAQLRDAIHTCDMHQPCLFLI